MKRFVLLVIIGFIALSSCTKDHNPSSLIGTWKLKQQLIDPGDGSGEFKNVTSNKKITFKADGTFSSNGSICYAGTSASEPSEGGYESSNGTLSTNCGINPMPVTYKLENKKLIIYYPCDEACQEKFEKQ